MPTACPKCGTRVEEGDEFCPECGAKTSANVQKEAPKLDQKKKSHPVLAFLLLLLVLFFVARACASFQKSTTYQPPVVNEKYYENPVEPSPPAYAPADSIQSEVRAQAQDIISPVYSEGECRKVKVHVEDACWSCGIVSCGLMVKARNDGEMPILKFESTAYINAVEKDESSLFEPLAPGNSNWYSVFTRGNDARMVELVPVIVSGTTPYPCKSAMASIGDAYGGGFKECVQGFLNQ